MQLVAGNKQLAARNMMLVARNKLRWCKRGIRANAVYQTMHTCKYTDNDAHAELKFNVQIFIQQ